MASELQVRTYLACWFQLGKAVIIPHLHTKLYPDSILQGDRYSQAFEDCWQCLQKLSGQECYLEGTSQTVAELLTGQWEIVPCARCTLPIPLKHGYTTDLTCPCHDLPNWPNNSIPIPHPPINLQQHLELIHQRVGAASQRYSQLRGSCNPVFNSNPG